MIKSMDGACEWRYKLGELRYYAVLCALVLMAPLSLVVALWLLPAAQAASSLTAEGASGMLRAVCACLKPCASAGLFT
ncbi:hypothetical protein [Serratia marcescens]|uniref:hypothetical protein n=1 Tax=Serratia marcescens TaxID=615 RepID=UPI00332DF040